MGAKGQAAADAAYLDKAIGRYPPEVAATLQRAIDNGDTVKVLRRYGLRMPPDHVPDVAELVAAVRASDLSAVLLAAPWHHG